MRTYPRAILVILGLDVSESEGDDTGGNRYRRHTTVSRVVHNIKRWVFAVEQVWPTPESACDICY